MRNIWRILSVGMLAAVLLSGCAQTQADVPASEEENTEWVYVEKTELNDVELQDEVVALASTPAVSSMLVPVASGTLVAQNNQAQIDYSNTADGYVMVRYTASTTKRLKVQVKGPTTTYTYNITPGDTWTTFPLSDGNGTYQVVVYENTSGSKYATVLSQSVSVTLKDEFAPFLRPNQYVDYEHAVKTVAKAKELTAGKTETLDKVAAVYDFVIQNITYDKQLAATVQSGYLPVLDSVLEKKTGICFDYAALMTAMLRSQGIPTKLEIGYSGDIYHAWISTWLNEKGWVDNIIQFDGKSWELMDPTLAANSDNKEDVKEYIGNGEHYVLQYSY